MPQAPSSSYRPFRTGRRLPGPAALALLVVLAALAGCQSTNPVDALSLSGKDAAASVPETQTVGSGPLKLAMLLPLSAEGAERDRAADYRDGAILAMQDLGGNRATLTVYDTKGVPTEVARLGKQAIAAASEVIIGPTTPGAVEALASAVAGELPVVLALTPDIPLNTRDLFTMKSNEADSADAVVSYAVAAGKSRFVVLAPEGYGPASLARVRKGIADSHGQLLGTVAYPSEAAAVPAAIAANAKLIGRASAVLLVAGLDTTAATRALRTEKLITDQRPLLATSAWPQAALADKSAEGALVALPSQAGLRQISERFTRTFGRPPSSDAAYAYDATAIVLGVDRVMGPTALTAETLASDKGFRGATGVFRFGGDGSIDRLLPVYVVRNGTMKLVKAAEPSF